jgi:hypothetical protein
MCDLAADQADELITDAYSGMNVAATPYQRAGTWHQGG